MNRELTNRIRYVIEELLPPALRDSWIFRTSAKLLWSHHIDSFAQARERAAFLSEEEYATIYRDYPRIHDHTDNSEACITRITADVIGSSICDVGCGTGSLLRRIRAHRDDVTRFVGIDVQLAEADPADGIEYHQGKIESLPFDDASFDTVICTHVLEHVLDLPKSISELRRIARRRLIIVVPREREGRYTFNPHFHFFPYTHSFLRAMHPVPSRHVCQDVRRDIYYREDCE